MVWTYHSKPMWEDNEDQEHRSTFCVATTMNRQVLCPQRSQDGWNILQSICHTAWAEISIHSNSIVDERRECAKFKIELWINSELIYNTRKRTDSGALKTLKGVHLEKCFSLLPLAVGLQRETVGSCRALDRQACWQHGSPHLLLSWTSLGLSNCAPQKHDFLTLLLGFLSLYLTSPKPPTSSYCSPLSQDQGWWPGCQVPKPELSKLYFSKCSFSVCVFAYLCLCFSVSLSSLS